MNSEKSGRKTWVKRAIEIFLVVLILLTFFSNTIMNASLAQVTVQKIQSGTIQEAVRGSGIVKAEEAHEMKAEKQWDVKEVRKKSGEIIRTFASVDIAGYNEARKSRRCRQCSTAIKPRNTTWP